MMNFISNIVFTGDSNKSEKNLFVTLLPPTVSGLPSVLNMGLLDQGLWAEIFWGLGNVLSQNCRGQMTSLISLMSSYNLAFHPF